MNNYRIYGVGTPIDVQATSTEHAELIVCTMYPELSVDRMVTRRTDE